MNYVNQIFAEYQLEKESGPAHAKSYTVRLHFGEKQYTGVDRSIKLAQRAAAQTALNDLSPTDTPNQELKSRLIFSLIKMSIRPID